MFFYQPSANSTVKKAWLEKFENILAQVSILWDGLIVITGDFNINLLKKDSDTAQMYTEILDTFGLTQHISYPTRKVWRNGVMKGAKLYDHISTNIPSNPVCEIVVPTDEISDHDMPFAVLQIKKKKFEPRYKFIRDEKNLNMNSYINDFKQLPLSAVYALDDPDDQLSILNQLITESIANHAPLKRTKFTRPPAPWMKDPKITNLQSQRNILRKKAFETQNDDDMQRYRDTRNRLKKSISSVKHDFYKTALSSKKPKLVWRTIHRILKPNIRKITATANDLNNYFCNVAENLTGKNTEEIAKLPTEDTETEIIFKMKPVTYHDIIKEIKSIRNDCSTGFDTIPAKFVKPVAEFIASPLTHIINNCIEKERFPKLWKTARVCAIPKVSSPASNSDYRPISILPILSKVFERIILKQMKTSLENYGALNDTQSGYRQGHSCVTLLHKLCDDINASYKKSEITLVVMADYSKAFDTVDHSTLLEKLKFLKFGNSFINLMNDYLTGRHQFVQIDDKQSTIQPVKFGVPQGSILGPILFNIYVHDLPEKIKSSTVQFADDTTLYRSCKVAQIESCSKQLQNDIDKVGEWSKECNLIFNSKKTKTMLFSTQEMSRLHKLNNNQILNISSCDNELERVQVMKLLGVTIQEHLKWNDHVREAQKATYGTLRALRQIKRMTPFRLRKNLAESLILTRIDYAVTLYGNNLQEYLKHRIQKVINSAAGYVYNRYSKQIDVVNLK